MPSPPFKKGEPILASRMNTVLAPLDRMVAAGGDVGQVPAESVGRRPGLRVRITARGSVADRFEFTQVDWDAATSVYIDLPNGATHETLGECVSRGRMLTAGMGMLFVGTIVLLEPGDQIDNDGRALWEFTPPPVMMPVDVTQVGGEDGSVTANLIPAKAAEGGNPATPEVAATTEAQASWTYDVYAEDGEKILSAVSPHNNRPSAGPVVPATQGYVHYELVGGTPTLTLGWVNEEGEFFGGYTGYDKLEGKDGSTASEKTGGTIKFDGALTGAHIDVKSAVSDGGGEVDTVNLWVDPNDFVPDPGGGPDPPYVPGGSTNNGLVHDGARWVAFDRDAVEGGRNLTVVSGHEITGFEIDTSGETYRIKYKVATLTFTRNKINGIVGVTKALGAEQTTTLAAVEC